MRKIDPIPAVGLSAEEQLESLSKLAWNLNANLCFCFALSAFFPQSPHKLINSPIILVR